MAPYILASSCFGVQAKAKPLVQHQYHHTHQEDKKEKGRENESICTVYIHTYIDGVWDREAFCRKLSLLQSLTCVLNIYALL